MNNLISIDVVRYTTGREEVLATLPHALTLEVIEALRKL